MKTGTKPQNSHVYYTLDGQGDVVAFNQGSAYGPDNKKDTLPIEAVQMGRVWVTNVGLLPISRKIENIFYSKKQALEHRK